MRYIILALLSILYITSCENGKSSNQKILSKSSGNINHISVVMDNELWEGSVGETVREVLAAPVDGLPQDEPLFSMNQIPTKVFSGFVRKNRTVLIIEKGSQPSVKIADDVFAKPQKVIFVSGNNNSEIINEIKTNSKKIINAFKSEELEERQRQIKLSLHKNNNINDKFGLTMNFPSAYRVANEDDKFLWIRKDITTGTTNLMLYELPLNAIRRNDSTVSQIIKVRDSIGEKYIKGRLDGIVNDDGEMINSYMITENAYAPFFFETIIDNKPTLEVRGVWELKNDFMGGPFLTYLIEDKINNRFVVAEGFAFAPSIDKREYMFELEAILRSIIIN